MHCREPLDALDCPSICMSDDPKLNEFEQAAAEETEGGFLAEIWGFLKENKKWWLLPIILTLLAFGVLVFLSGTGLAPFIYTLF